MTNITTHSPAYLTKWLVSYSDLDTLKMRMENQPKKINDQLSGIFRLISRPNGKEFKATFAKLNFDQIEKFFEVIKKLGVFS
jgi:hypothetical protein